MPQMNDLATQPTLPPIHDVRRQRVVLDADLAARYGVATKVFNPAVRRNTVQFPDNFAFQPTNEDVANLKSQNVTSMSSARGRHRGYLPWAFTKHGAILAACSNVSPSTTANSSNMRRAPGRHRKAAAFARCLATAAARAHQTAHRLQP